MRVSVLLVGVIVAPLAPTCEAQGWGELALAVGNKLIGLWSSDQLDFLEHTCNYSVRPKIARFRLYFRGNIWCPGWTSIIGEAMARSRSDVAGLTMQDFARKDLQTGLITEDQAHAWLLRKYKSLVPYLLMIPGLTVISGAQAQPRPV